MEQPNLRMYQKTTYAYGQVLCAERVSQMNRTYNDIEAVTRLLEEKETDLELAARIGQGLLEKNKKLEEKNEVLEEQLNVAHEKISQLRHELNMKDALLQSYNEDYELEVSTTPLEGSVLDRSVSQCDNLQKKVKILEEENVQLKLEAEQLTAETCDLEEQEVTLVSDCVRQLDDANRKIKELQTEMKAKADVCVAQQEDNTNLLSKVITVESNYKKQLAENTELSKQMKQMKVTQLELTSEIIELEEKYEETMALLNEKSEEMKSLRKKNNPSVIHQHYGTSPFFRPEGSLALEIEKSETEELCPDGYTTKHRKKHMSKVLETAKTVNRAIDRHNSQASLSSLSIHSLLSDTMSDRNDSICMSDTLSDTESAMSESFSQTDTETMAFGSGVLGKPGIPGSNDLETALRRLAIRQANEINQSFLDEQDQQNGNITARSTGDNTPTPCPTPDSYMSTGSASLHSSSVGGYRGVPEKLQIVKPIEGSHTLHHWQRLATPRLEGLLEYRPGVQVRGEKPLELDEDIYTLSDYEEDGMSLSSSYEHGLNDHHVTGSNSYDHMMMNHTGSYITGSGCNDNNNRNSSVVHRYENSNSSFSSWGVVDYGTNVDTEMNENVVVDMSKAFDDDNDDVFLIDDNSAIIHHSPKSYMADFKNAGDRNGDKDVKKAICLVM